MKKVSSYCFYLIVVLFSFSFASSTGRIGWQEHRPIQWDDFEGVPDYSDEFRDAVTASALKFTNRCRNDGSLEVIVAAEFVKDQSWVKEVARSDYHLDHERLHFDITELYARKFREYIASNDFSCADRDFVQGIIYRYLSECVEYQGQYDKETRYSLHRGNQAEWEEKIELKLKEFDDFSSK